jgi:uncharacterized protein YutE (UPF0331/DUF86 family)
MATSAGARSLKERIQQKSSRVIEYLELIDSIKDDCEKRFIADPIYRGAMLHYLYLMADTCIALAEQIIRDRKLRLPQSYHESFDILGDAGILTPEFAYSFSKIAGFRNFLAHDYERVEAKVICHEVLNNLADVRVYVQQIKDYYSANS